MSTVHCGFDLAHAGRWAGHAAWMPHDKKPKVTVTNVTPNRGPHSGFTSVIVTGTNFAAGALVYFDGVLAKYIQFLSSTSIACATPAHAAGWVPCTVINPDMQHGTLANAFYYDTTLHSISINLAVRVCETRFQQCLYGEYPSVLATNVATGTMVFGGKNHGYTIAPPGGDPYNVSIRMRGHIAASDLVPDEQISYAELSANGVYSDSNLEPYTMLFWYADSNDHSFEPSGPRLGSMNGFDWPLVLDPQALNSIRGQPFGFLFTTLAELTGTGKDPGLAPPGLWNSQLEIDTGRFATLTLTCMW